MSNAYLPSEDAVKAGMERIRSGTRLRGDRQLAGDEPRKRGRRERASTFSATRSGHRKDERDGKSGAEGRKGWRTLVKMLSKGSLRGGHTNARGQDNSGSRQVEMEGESRNNAHTHVR